MKTMHSQTTIERLNLDSSPLTICVEATTTLNKVKESHSLDHHRLVQSGKSRVQSHKCVTIDSQAPRGDHSARLGLKALS